MLTNPINSQNVVDRFAQYVQATANSGIVWGTDALPFGHFPAHHFGGTTSGKPIEVNGGSIGGVGATVSASAIYNVLVAETIRYTRIRNLRARDIVAGNHAAWGAGVHFDQTRKAHMSAAHALNIPAFSNIAAGQPITTGGLEQLFNNLRTWYSGAAASVVSIDITRCHGECYSNRNRR